MSVRKLCAGFASVLLLGSASVVADTPACEQPLRIIRNAEYEPDDDDRFLQAVMAHAGCELRIVISAHRITLPRRFELLRAGEIDLVIGVSRLPDREGFGRFSVPFRREVTRVWIRQQDRARAEGNVSRRSLHLFRWIEWAALLVARSRHRHRQVVAAALGRQWRAECG